MSLTTGAKLGPYEILAPLGAGGMGEVYKAKDTRLDRTVAIKVLPSHLSDNAQLRERFEREARAVSSLNHPHICTLHDIGSENGIDYMVMEHIEGDTLADRLKKGALPLEQALQYGIQIADALDKAHRQGVVHRDLKPGNIMLTKSGAKLLDFGLAKMSATPTSANGLSALPTEAQPLTQEGSILGTFQYMAPEQLEGKEADARTDLFAFGVVVYEMATGRKAFEGTSQASLIGAIMNSEPEPMTEVQTMTPPALDRVVKKCLAKAQEERWQSAKDLHDELRWIADGGSEVGVARDAAGVSSRTSWRGAIPLALALGVGAIFASVAAWNFWPVPSLPVTRTVVALQADEVIPPTTIAPLALSPDGSHMVYSAQKGNDPPRLYLRPMNSLEDEGLLGTEGGDNPFFSSDGRWVGFFAGGEMKKVSITGGAVVTISSTSERPQGASWGADDRIIFSAVSVLGLLRVSADGGTTEVLTASDASAQGIPSWPQILPGGQAVLFVLGGAIMVQRLDTREAKLLVQRGKFPHYISTGHLVYDQAGTLMAVPFDPGRLEISGFPVPVIEGIRSPGTLRGGAQFALSRTGTLAYVPGTVEEFASTLVWVDRQGVAESLPAPPRLYEYPQISPDGQRVAVGIAENELHVWVYDVSRDALTRLTLEGVRNTVPVWSPDAQRIAFVSSREGPLNMFWQMADGSGDMERLTTNDRQTPPASFSPDGQLLAFTVPNPETGRDIWVLNLADREAHPFLQERYEETAPKFSPDGKWMAYTSDESGRREVYVRPYPGPGAKWQISTNGGHEVVWNPEGGMFYRSGSSMMAVAVDAESDFRPGKPQMLFEGPYLPTRFSYPFYDVRPDGQRFLMLQPVESATGGASQINVVLNWFEELKRLVPTN